MTACRKQKCSASRHVRVVLAAGAAGAQQALVQHSLCEIGFAEEEVVVVKGLLLLLLSRGRSTMKAVVGVELEVVRFVAREG